jgi:DNA-binding IclR family transcriptional regulator
MVARRRKPRRSRARKTFSVPLIETGAGLALLAQSDAGTHLKAMLEGNVQQGLSGLNSSIQANKNLMIKTLASAFIAKQVVRGFGGSKILARIGPVVARA